MRLYRTNAGQWLGTQADARAAAGKAWELIDVPTDKDGLIGFLNARPTPAPIATPAPAPPPAAASSAAVMLDRMDRQALINAIGEARAALDSGLRLVQRKHSAEPAPIAAEGEGAEP